MLIADKMLVQTFHAPFPGAWAHGEGRPELSVRPGSLEPGCLTCAKPHPKCKAALRGAAEERDEFAACHSITSSARCCRNQGTSRPSALAVLRFTTSSNLVGACTGRSPGFSPRRTRSTYDAASRYTPALLIP